MEENEYEFQEDYGICFTNNKQFFFLFDIEDYELISQRIWSRRKTGYFFSKYRTHKSQILLHRLIMGDPEGKVIDHINGDKSDNRKSNLRITTYQQNSFNRHKDKGLIGVYYEKDRNKWCSMLSTKEHGIYRNRFDTKEEAIRDRLEAELKFFGRDYAPQRELFQKYQIGEE